MANLVLCLLILRASFPIPAPCHEELRQLGKHAALFVFGDSLFDPGNNQYINGSGPGPSNFWPYGETYFKHPTGRLSDGRLVPDFIAEFAKLPLIPPYLQPGGHRFTDGASFASAGAGVLVETHPGKIHLRMQLSYFKKVENLLRHKLGDVKAKKMLMRAVYLFSVGGNDYFNLYTANPNVPQSYQQEFVRSVISNLTIVLKEIYRIGGRKFAFQNAGPLGCIPGLREMNQKIAGGCAEEPSALARLHNMALSNVLKKLESQLAGLKYSIFDYYNSLSERINNPLRFGFREGKVACCGSGPYRGSNCGGRRGTMEYELCSNPSEYVWFDSAHTTERANQQLAELLWSGTPNVTGPYNLKQLFECM